MDVIFLGSALRCCCTTGLVLALRECHTRCLTRHNLRSTAVAMVVTQLTKSTKTLDGRVHHFREISV